MDLKPHMMVTDRSQRSGYTAVYRIIDVPSDHALVQYVGEWSSGRFQNMSHRREESYRLVANLQEFKS